MLSVKHSDRMTDTTNNSESVARIKPAAFGSISTGTLRTEDLLQAFGSELESQILRNGDYFSRPENFVARDRLANLIGEWQDATDDDGNLIDEEQAIELLQEIEDMLQTFAPAYGHFGAHFGDGADFGFWVDVDDVKEQVDFVSSREQEYPADDYEGEWLHVNDHGNCTLYVRANGQDTEIWSIV